MIQLAVLPGIMLSALVPLSLFVSPNTDTIHIDPIVPTVQAQKLAQPLQADKFTPQVALNPVLIPKSYDIPYSATDIIAAVNAVRQRAGLQPLVEDGVLDLSASVKARDMCTNDYYAHANPTTGERGVNLILNAGGFTYAGENLAAGYQILNGAVLAWTYSPAHYEAIINPAYSETGAAAIVCDGFRGSQQQIIIVQHFGGF